MQCLNLAAYTPVGHPYPPYLSINREEDGRVSIAVRSPAKGPNADQCGDVACIYMSDVQAAEIFAEAQLALARIVLNEPKAQES